MNNEFLNLISSPLMNLDHTYRYSGTKLVEAESLSQHIVDTIMMGLKIIDTINIMVDDRYYLDPSKYVMKAVYHDLEEVVTGDIPRPLKYFNDDTRDSLKDVADKVASEFFCTQFKEGYSHYNIWDNAKEGKEGYILKLVDTLVVAGKVVKEVALLNNMYMLRVAHEVIHYLEEQSNYLISHGLEHKSANRYLRSLLDGAIESMESILKDNIDKIGVDVIQQSMLSRSELNAF